MFEFVARLIAVLAAIGVSFGTGRLSIETVWQAGSIYVVLAILLEMADRKGLRNPGLSGWMTVLDAAFIAVMLSETKLLDRAGFIVLLPLVYGVGRHGVSAIAAAPLISGSVLVCANTFGVGWTMPVLIQAVGVLAVGLFAQQRTKTITQREVVEVPIVVESEMSGIEAEELQESVRQLKLLCKKTEANVRSEETVARILASSHGKPSEARPTLAETTRQLAGASGVAILALEPAGHALVAFASNGRVPESAADAAVDTRGTKFESQVLAKVELEFRAHDSDSTIKVHPLSGERSLVGVVVCLYRPDQPTNDRALTAKVLSALASAVRLVQEREEESRRAAETEVLYQLSSTANGADSPLNVVARAVRESFAAHRLDHLSFRQWDTRGPVTLASQGASFDPLDSMSFAGGSGANGWFATSTPELYLPDARDDMRMPTEVALKKRIGSVAVLPVWVGDEFYGYFTAATNRVNGIGRSVLESLRIVAGETGRALNRLTAATQEPEGLATPQEFAQVVADTKFGALVHLEVLRRDELVEAFGRPAYDQAAARCAARLRSALPHGAMMCRRSEGDFVVLLKRSDERSARSWANEAVALVSMLTITTPDGRHRIPFGLRSKVADIGTQSDQVSTGSAA